MSQLFLDDIDLDYKQVINVRQSHSVEITKRANTLAREETQVDAKDAIQKALEHPTPLLSDATITRSDLQEAIAKLDPTRNLDGTPKADTDPKLKSNVPAPLAPAATVDEKPPRKAGLLRLASQLLIGDFANYTIAKDRVELDGIGCKFSIKDLDGLIAELMEAREAAARMQA